MFEPINIFASSSTKWISVTAEVCNFWESSRKLTGQKLCSQSTRWFCSIALPCPVTQLRSTWEEIMDLRLTRQYTSFWLALPCMLLLMMLEEHLFLLGCLPLLAFQHLWGQAHAPSLVEQPVEWPMIGQKYCQNNFVSHCLQDTEWLCF